MSRLALRPGWPRALPVPSRGAPLRRLCWDARTPGSNRFPVEKSKWVNTFLEMWEWPRSRINRAAHDLPPGWGGRPLFLRHSVVQRQSPPQPGGGRHSYVAKRGRALLRRVQARDWRSGVRFVAGGGRKLGHEERAALVWKRDRQGRAGLARQDQQPPHQPAPCVDLARHDRHTGQKRNTER